jgi:hypothetical protein
MGPLLDTVKVLVFAESLRPRAPRLAARMLDASSALAYRASRPALDALRSLGED